MAAIAEVKCLDLGLGLFRFFLGDAARAEAVAALYEAMVFVVSQGVRHGGLFHQGREILPCGGLKGGKVDTPAVGAVVGLGVGAGGPEAFLAADV